MTADSSTSPARPGDPAGHRPDQLTTDGPESDRPVFAAVDIGASSGRVVAGWMSEGGLQLAVVHRFPNGTQHSKGHLRWDLTGLYEQVLIGLRKLASRHATVISIGIDTWAVDYGLIDDRGELLAEPVAYRDERSAPVVDTVHQLISQDRLYSITGLQHLPFNTIYQLAAEREGPLWGQAQHAILLPDLLAFWLTGQLRTEISNASTTGLLDAQTRSWSAEIFERLNLPAELFPPLIEPGEVVGQRRKSVASFTGLDEQVQVIAVGSHDTASAVVGVPATGVDYAYVSSGTWSLVGLELDEPVLSERSRRANFTNEGGVDARIRYLRNEGGLWLLQESLRTWREAGQPADQAQLLAQAARLPTGGPVIDVGSPQFLAPGDMPTRIRAACQRAGTPLPEGAAHVVRCILDSLALAYSRTIDEAQSITGRAVSVIHIVGGGCQNQLLCQLSADLSGLPVLAGPVEATAMGNLAVQARAAGVLPETLDDLRAELRRGSHLTTYRPGQPPHASLHDQPTMSEAPNRETVPAEAVPADVIAAGGGGLASAAPGDLMPGQSTASGTTLSRPRTQADAAEGSGP